jgi:hypothetical protein
MADDQMKGGHPYQSDRGLLIGVRVRVEEAACLAIHCLGQLHTTVFLAWDSPFHGESTAANPEGSNRHVIPVEPPAIALTSACVDVTAADVVAALPAVWTLEAWAAGQHRAPHTNRPRFIIGQAVECRFVQKELSQESLIDRRWGPWEAVTVAAVGYREDSWKPDARATYVVRHLDGRLLTVARDDMDYIRAVVN